MKITPEELNNILTLHQKWLADETDGERINLSDVDLSSSDLSNTDLTFSILNSCNLSNSDLSNANLYGAILNYTNFSNADLRNANLADADLYGANLQGANLDFAILYNVNLDKACFPIDEINLSTKVDDYILAQKLYSILTSIKCWADVPYNIRDLLIKTVNQLAEE